MKKNILILFLFYATGSAFAQPDSIPARADTALRVEVAEQPQPAAAYVLDPLMVAPPKTMMLPLRSEPFKVGVFESPYASGGNTGFAAKAPEQKYNNLDNFYRSYNASMQKMLERNKALDIMGISATAFVWGMVVKQAIEGAPNPNVKPKAGQKPQTGLPVK